MISLLCLLVSPLVKLEALALNFTSQPPVKEQ